MGVVTPEAVPLRFEDAGVGTRGAAFLLDAVILLVALGLLNFAVALTLEDVAGGLPAWVPVTVVTLLNFLVLLGYPIGFETLLRGRTPGKAALGLRVVTVEGAPVRFRHAALRAALGLIDFGLTFGAAAVISALVTSRHQRLGDLVAGTVVLRERTGWGRPEAAVFQVPPGAEAYAAMIDASGLTPRQYEALRAFLLRASDLPAERRAALADQLAAALAPVVRHQRPPGVSSELFLRCLAARAQQRP